MILFRDGSELARLDTAQFWGLVPAPAHGLEGQPIDIGAPIEVLYHLRVSWPNGDNFNSSAHPLEDWEGLLDEIQEALTKGLRPGLVVMVARPKP